MTATADRSRPPASAAESSARMGAIGLGWRPETALFIDRRPALGFTEIVAESICSHQPIPVPIEQLRDRGVAIAVHGVSLSLGGAEPLRTETLDRLASLAERLHAPFVSEHIALVRSGGIDAGHLLPVAHTREMVDIVSENIAMAQRWLPVPLVVENIAALFQWPENEMTEPAFIRAVLDRTNAQWLFDVSNFYANCINDDLSFETLLDQMPLDRIAYIHVAGGKKKGSLYHDTHAHPIGRGSLDALGALCQRLPVVPPILLERDAGFGGPDALAAELDAIAASSQQRGVAIPLSAPPPHHGADAADVATPTQKARTRQASAQQALVRALVRGEPAPPGFDRSRIDAAGRALYEKKLRYEQRTSVRQKLDARYP